MGELGALFNPGMRHELEERRARAARREEEGNARDGDLRIDLESGVAVISAAGDEDRAEADDTPASGPVAAAAPPDQRPDVTADDPDASSSAEPAPSSGAEPAPSAEAEPAPSAEAEPAPSAEAEPAPLRPRGKRAMSAARR